jgi:integrase
LKDLVERFLAAKRADIEPTTWGEYRQRLRTYVCGESEKVDLSRVAIGEIPLARLTPVHVLDWKLALEEKGIGARMRQNCFDVLRRCLAFGVKPLGLLARNPADGVQRPAVEKPEIRALTAEEAQRLLRVAEETAPPWVRAAVALGLCGLRRGEVFGLAWKDIDRGFGRLRVRQALKEPEGGKKVGAERTVGPVKTRAARRWVPLPPWAQEALSAHRRALGVAPLPTRLVFTTAADTPVRFSNFSRRHFAPLVERAGLSGTTFHALRHTAATLLIAGGADIKSVQTVLGHTMASTTLDMYCDAVPSRVDEAMERLGNVVRDGV